MKPAALVSETFGGVRKTARLLKLTPGAVSHWKRRGGSIPSQHHRKILALSKRLGKTLSANDLIFGRA